MTTPCRLACALAALFASVSHAQTPSALQGDALYAAIRGGNRAQIEQVIREGADVNARDRRGGATPLMHAAALGSIDALQLLVDRGAEVNARSAAGATALMWAATDIVKVRVLVERGADVNAVSESGRTALMLAAFSDRSAEIVRFLLAHGADAKAIDREEMSTLFAATYGNDTATVRELVKAGVDVNAANIVGITPLMNAASAGNQDVVKLLLASGAKVNAVSGAPAFQVKNGTIDLGEFTPLILASAYGPSRVVRTLLEAGADVNAKESRGMTPLMYAAATDHGQLDIARLLVSRGADLGATSEANETALDWAQKSRATPLVTLLKRAGAPAAPAPARRVVAPAPVAARPAVERGVALLERASNTFFTNGACGSCHGQNITDIAVAAARRARVPHDATAAAQRSAGASAAFGATATRLFERFDGPALDILLYSLAGFAAAGHPADRATDAMIFNVAAQQLRDGRWHGGGIPRPPIEDGDFTRTALGIHAMKTYGPPGRGAEMADRVSRATGWLRRTKPLTAEDRSFRLLGLAWAGDNPRALQRAAREITARQQTDGGWAQRDEMDSDVYATGLTMYALLETGSARPSDAAVQRAAGYLLSTQRADGSWFVRSRSAKFQPYFDGGFPYEHDQWISSMATGWATAALAESLAGAATTASR